MTEQEYADALARIEVLMELEPGPKTPEGIELDALTDRLVEYEKKFIFGKGEPGGNRE